MNRFLVTCAVTLLSLLPIASFAQQTAITRYARFTGNLNFVTTGGSLRTQSNAGDSCAVGTSSSQALTGIPAGASIVAAYLYWGGSGAVDGNVTLNGAPIAAQRTFSATFNNSGTNLPYFGAFADVTARVAGNGTLTFGGLTVNTSATFCDSSAVAAGWSVVAIYGSATERLRAINVFDGLQYFRGSSLTLNPDGFRIPPANIDGRMAIFALEGDPGNSTALTGFSEELRFNGTAVDDGILVAGSDPPVQPYDGTVNTAGVATAYGVDVDTFDVSARLAPGQTSATTVFSTGGDLVLLMTQVVSVTSDPVVDLSITKTHTGNFTFGQNATYTLTVANAAGNQRDDNTIVVTDTLPPGLTYVSATGTGWTCGATGQQVTCSRAPPLAAGASAPPIALTVAVGAAAVPNVSNTASVASASVDVNAANNTATDAAVVRGPNLSTSTKTVVDVNGGEPDPGDTLRYTIALVETAGVAASGVSIVDDLAADLGALAVVSLPPGAVDASTGAGTGANNTGRLDVRNVVVPANGSITVVFDVRIAAGTPPNTPIDNTATITNPAGLGATPVAPQLRVSPSAIPASGTKALYLRSSPAVALSRTPPASDAAVTVAFGAPVTWALSPALALPITLPAGNVSIPLYLLSTGAGSTRTLQVTLSASGVGNIGSATQTIALATTGTPTLATFVVNNAVTRTLPVGATLSATITQTAPNNAGRTTRLFPIGSTGNFSRVSLNSATVINVDSVQAFSTAYPGATASGTFRAGETVYARAVVSDPFGNFDIAAANVTILDPSGTVRQPSTAMALVASPTAATRTYEFAYAVPPGAPLGGWSIRVTGVEGTEGVVTHTRVAGFVVAAQQPALSVQKTVALVSDPVNGASNPRQIPGSLQRYRITVRNTGTGTVDASTLVVVDAVPQNAQLYVATSGGPPVQFFDGGVPSGLTYDYSTNVTYSNRPGGAAPFDYVPTPDSNGFDANVTALRVAPTGTLAGANGASQPSFAIEFRVRVP